MENCFDPGYLMTKNKINPKKRDDSFLLKRVFFVVKSLVRSALICREAPPSVVHIFQ